MSILDALLFNPADPLSRSCFDTMYAICVAQAEAWEQAIRDLEAVRTGEPTMSAGRWRQIEVRCMSEERIRWGTTRNAVEGRNWDPNQLNHSGGAITEPQPVPDPRPQPIPVTVGGPGGLRIHCSDPTARPLLSPAEMAALLPDEPGPFTFPAPYLTSGIRLTTEADGRVNPIGMSYWNNVSWTPDRSGLLLFLSIDDQLWLYTVDVVRGTVGKVRRLPFHHTGEGIYWLRDAPTTLCIPAGRDLIWYDVWNEHQGVLASMPAEATQWHSSADGTVHSCSLVGGRLAVAFGDGQKRIYGTLPDYDECQIDKSGQYLIVKYGAGANKIIHLSTGREWEILNAEGAVGHSDVGYGWLIGEDDYAAEPGAFRLWELAPTGPKKGPVVYHQLSWDPMTRYVAHGNAVNSIPGPQVALFTSTSTGSQPRGNELVLARLDGSLSACAVCPTLTDLNAPGGGDVYWRNARPNVDPHGKVACWTGNWGSDRLDAFLVVLPSF